MNLTFVTCIADVLDDLPLSVLRSLGDLNYKRFGVTPEPQVRTMLLKGRRPLIFRSTVPYDLTI